MDIELLHFRFSPYNEKVRWALDLKRVPHLRRSLLPGPHFRTVRPLTGQSATPILRVEDRWIAGSSLILDILDARYPTPPLYPADPRLREEAIEVERVFDEELGPRVRRALLATLIEDAGYITRVFGGDKPAYIRLPYRLTFPFAKGLIARGNGITGPESVEDGLAAVETALSTVADRSAKTGYLVGDEFSVADLTAASMLATLIDMPGTPMERPKPRPAALVKLVEPWVDHPGADWTRGIFARHRGPGMADGGLIDYGAANAA
jgi:glutathione S-transferase